jgi:hypothetical protein
MTSAMAVAGALAFSFALAALIRMVDGATLRRWRLSRRWDVTRLAREFIKAADEPIATLRGLTHMINAWERGARRPSERYWLLYLRLFPEYASLETIDDVLQETAALPDTDEITAVQATTRTPASTGDAKDISTLAATVKALEKQVARLSRRLEELSRDERDERGVRQSPRVSGRGRKARPGNWGWNGIALWTVLVPSLQP